MTVWAAPQWLLALAVLPAGLGLAFVWLQEVRRRHRTLAPTGLWAKMRLGPDGRVMALRLGLVLLAIALVIVALADPRMPGGKRVGQGPGRLLIALDLSKSMEAQDALGGQSEAISRFEAAKDLIRDLPDFLPGWELGLLVFAADPMMLCPTTRDVPALLTLLEHARPGDPAMRQGTDIEQALTAGSALLGDRRGAILLLTDGEELTGQARHAIGLLRSRRLPVYAVGLGLDSGTPLVHRDGTPLTWRGQQVRSARHDRLLDDLARQTGGAYFPSRDVVSPGGLEVAAPPSALAIASRLHVRAIGASPLGASRRNGPLALAYILLLADGFVAIRGRKGKLGIRKVLRAAPIAAAGLVAIPACALLISGWTWPSWSLTRQAEAASRRGRPLQAVGLLEKASDADPDDGAVRYDLANALVRTGHRAQAVAEYRRALSDLASGSALAERTWYNLGNACFESGDRPQAAADYREALTLDPRDADAAHNLALCRPQPPPPVAPAPDRSRASAPGSTAVPRPSDVAPTAPPDANQLLQALQDDERIRARIATQRAAQAPPQAAPDDPSAIARQMLQAARQSIGLASQRDW